MSVTFSAIGAPETSNMVPCYMDGCSALTRCGYCKDGLLDEPLESIPSLNLANGNARAILSLVGLEDEFLSGGLEVEGIAPIRQRIFVLRNSEKRRAAAIREPEDKQEAILEMSGGAVEGVQTLYRMSPRMITAGLDDDGILDRLERLDELLAAAQAGGFGVSWG